MALDVPWDIKRESKQLYLLRLAISTTNCCNYNMACLCTIAINYCCFHFLKKQRTYEYKDTYYKPGKNKEHRQNRQVAKYVLHAKLTFSSLIFMSFISSGNLSTPTLWEIGSLKPEVGATPTEAICQTRKEIYWSSYSCSSLELNMYLV